MSTVTKRYVDYQPRGPIKRLWTRHDAFILAEGPANTGKTRAIAEWCYAMAEAWPQCRILVSKLTRKSLTESVIPTFEDDVFPAGHPALAGAGKENRHAYRFPNGAAIIFAGLDDPAKRYSEQYDIIWVNEAFQISLDVYERFFRALRNKRILHPEGKVLPEYISKDTGKPDVDKIKQDFGLGKFERWKNCWPDGSPVWFYRIILDTNPDVPHHWQNVLANEGKLTRIVTRHRDNPTFSPADQAALDALTGVRRRRLRDGQWCAAEGQVWEDFDADKHIVDDVPRRTNGEPAFAHYVMAQDWGFRAPGALLMFGLTYDGVMYLFREQYRAGKAIDWWIQIAERMNRSWPAIACVCDSAEPGSIDLYRKAGIPAIEADKRNKRTSLDQVRDRLRTGGLFFVRDALQERDQALKAVYQPCCTVEEIPAYVLREIKEGRAVDDETDPACADHGCDALRYAVRYVDSMFPSKAIVRSDQLDNMATRWSDELPEELAILERGNARDAGAAPIRWPWSGT